MKSVLLVEIDHDRELPEPASDIVQQRLWNWLVNAGLRCDVTARLLEVKPQPIKPWEVS